MALASFMDQLDRTKMVWFFMGLYVLNPTHKIGPGQNWQANTSYNPPLLTAHLKTYEMSKILLMKEIFFSASPFFLGFNGYNIMVRYHGTEPVQYHDVATYALPNTPPTPLHDFFQVRHYYTVPIPHHSVLLAIVETNIIAIIVIFFISVCEYLQNLVG